MSKRLSEGVGKGRQRRRLPDYSTPLRRSTRLSNRPTPSYSSSLSSSVYSRPTLPRYNEEEFRENETLDESGQSVPLDFDQDVVNHDHSYSQGASSRRVNVHDYRVPSPIIRETTPTSYGLDADEDELNQLQHTRDYDLYDKERILTTTVIKGPSLCSQIISKFISFTNLVGSLLYLLFAKVVLCDITLYRRSADCCGRYSKGILQSIAFFMVFFGFVFVTSTIPYIEYPPPPPNVSVPPPPPTPAPIPPVMINDSCEGCEQLLKALNDLRNDFNTYKLAQVDVIHDLKKIVSDYFENDTDEMYFLRSELVSYINEVVANGSDSRKAMMNEKSDSILKKMDQELSSALGSLEDKLNIYIDKRFQEANIMDEARVGAIAKGEVDKAVSDLETSVNDKLDKLIERLKQLKENQVNELIQASGKWNAKLSELQEKQKQHAQRLQDELDGVSGDLSELKKEQQNEIAKLKKDLNTLSSKIVQMETDINKFINKDLTLPSGIITKDNVSSMIKDALHNYTADQVARFDYALESAGGHVISSSDTYDPSNTKAILFGYPLPISLSRSHPTFILQPSVMPGDCWCFKGTEGFVTIKLATSAIVDAVTVQHIPKELSPVGAISSAMKSFTVKGSNSVTDKGTDLDTFEYLKDGPPIQTFDIKNKEPYSFIKFSVNSNHGSQDYTCIYRIRVHGALPLRD